MLLYDPVTGEFDAYDENDPLRKVMVGGEEFLLNFAAGDGEPIDGASGIHTDGDDAIFGDLGNDWLVGGTGRDHLYGGYGDDLINADDYLDTNDGANDAPDGPEASYEDIAFGGGGRDVLIANTGGDRLIDWAGEFNSFLVPFSPFGVPTISRSPSPHIERFLYDLSKSDGADQTLGPPDDPRNGEPFGELGLVRQGDADWGDQTGAPADPQPGNSKGSRDVLRSAPTEGTTAESTTVTSSSGLDPMAEDPYLVFDETTGGLVDSDPETSLPDGGVVDLVTDTSTLTGSEVGTGDWIIDPVLLAPVDNGNGNGKKGKS